MSNAEELIHSYFNGIEQVITDHIYDAQSSIYIAMAWLTSSMVKNALISAKLVNPLLQISIVVDDNEINDQYFFNSRQQMEQAGIILKPNTDPRFLHRKFMVIDQKETLIGSYNYTKRAKQNAENLISIKNELIAKVHIRIFQQMTNSGYVDENVRLLFDHPAFAQELLSTYYKFSKAEYQKYANKIILGDCFTYDVGDYNELRYSPGFVFNPRGKWDKKLRCEFPLPVSKKRVMNWIEDRNQNVIIDGYRDYPDHWNEISDALEQNKVMVDKSFRRLIESTYSSTQLLAKIQTGINLIKEDNLWEHNFELFLRPDLAVQLLDGFPNVERHYPMFDLEVRYQQFLKRLV
jgi:hypothetical protein